MKTHSLGITPDGPKGPRREMALGAVYLASRLQKPIVPVGFGYERPFRLNTWDQFAIPKPGSRVRAIMGPKIIIPRKADRDELEASRVSIADNITRLTMICEESANSGKSIESEEIFLKTRHLQNAKKSLTLDSKMDRRLAFDLRSIHSSKRAAA